MVKAGVACPSRSLTTLINVGPLGDVVDGGLAVAPLSEGFGVEQQFLLTAVRLDTDHFIPRFQDRSSCYSIKGPCEHNVSVCYAILAGWTVAAWTATAWVVGRRRS